MNKVQEKPVLALTFHDVGKNESWDSVTEHHLDEILYFLNSEMLKEAVTDVVITFDDGLQSQYSAAKTILQKHRMKAIFFICPGLVGTEGHMSWKQLKDLVTLGHEIGCHSLNHDVLTSLTKYALMRNCLKCKRAIEEGLGIKAKSFSIPFGETNSRVVKILRKAGFEYVYTSGERLGSRGSYQIPRININELKDISFLRNLIFDRSYRNFYRVLVFGKWLLKRTIGMHFYREIRRNLF